MVIVDNQMGLEDIDPNATNDDDGFQEVMSRKAKVIAIKQQKAQVEVSLKKLAEQQQHEKSAKSGSKKVCKNVVQLRKNKKVFTSINLNGILP